MASTKPGLRTLPITVIDSGKTVPEETRADHHDHADEGPRSLGRPAPCMVFVGDTGIDEAQIAREMQHHRAMKPEQSRAAAARALVVRELLRREVERLGLADDVQAASGEPVEEACIRVLLEREVENRTPSEDDCRRYFEANRERFRAPDRIKLRHILLAAAPADSDGRFKARTQGEQLIAELKQQPHLFADFALRLSSCPSKDEGGELGWLERGQTTPEFDRQIFRLREGLAGFPVESRWGYHVVNVDALASGEPQDYAAVRERISDYLELQVRQQELQHYLQDLQERYEVRGLED
ncbi:MAG: peptidyl-prolyl cis-trans isomerase [Proteobacteria bacterium]|nr:peptidyl-prolyl cis-trans isomerase [Pseudomonadota bacterium]